MRVAIVTVGDELLAGDTENTNATWIARQLTDRGVAVARVLTLPDDREAIAEAVDRYRGQFDRVVVTGGLGGTHDDVTMHAVATALDRDLAVDPDARADVIETVAAFRESHPDLVDEYPDLEIDADAQASIPEGARYLPNPVGLAPGCVADGVYVLPGIPDEMKAMFESVADEFAGDATSETVHTPAPEGALTTHLDAVRERFDVAVGSYPARGDEYNRIKVGGEDPDAVADALGFLRDQIDVVDPEDDDGNRESEESGEGNGE